MTKEQMSNELIYQASLSPFKVMLKKRVISEEDYHAVDTKLREKYSPIFVEKCCQIQLDNNEQ